MKCKIGQSSMELVILTAFLLFSAVVFMAFLQQNISQKESERKNILVNEVIYDIEGEVNLAHASSEGYAREFNVPLKIEESEYNVSIVAGILYIRTLDNKYSSAIKVSPVTGQVVIGKNLIYKEGGIVYLNYEK